MYRIELYQFWNNSDHLAIHCDTEEKAKKLCEALGEIGAEWDCCEELFSSDATYWEVYKSNTCYTNHGFLYNYNNMEEDDDIYVYEFDDVDLDWHKKVTTLTFKKNDRYMIHYRVDSGYIVYQVGKFEEETGISLELVNDILKCLKEGLYVRYDNDEIIHCNGEIILDYCTTPDNTNCLCFKVNIYKGIYGFGKEKIYLVKDYGKTWAFEKEDVKVEWD